MHPPASHLETERRTGGGAAATCGATRCGGGAETWHAAPKTRSFNLEDTGLTKAARLLTRLIAVSPAFVQACLTGELMVARQQIKRNKYGCAPIRVFRLGLDTLPDSLLHPCLLTHTFRTSAAF